MQESVIVKLSLGAHLRRQHCHSVTVDKNRSYCFNIFALLKIHQHQNHLFYWGLCHLHHGVHSLSHWMSHQMDQICPLKQRIKVGKIFSLKSRAWFKLLSNWELWMSWPADLVVVLSSYTGVVSGIGGPQNSRFSGLLLPQVTITSTLGTVAIMV